MRKINPTPWTLLILSAGLLAINVQTATAEETRHPLWKVDGKENTLWLHGSIHFLKRDFYPLPEPIEQAYRDSEVVVFETDLDPSRMMATALRMAQAGMYPPGEVLRDHVSDDVYNALRNRLQRSGIPPAVAEQMRPWMAALTLAVVELQRMGFDPDHGVDRYFHRKAVADKKTVLALETIEAQVRLFTGLTGEQQQAFLSQTLEDFDRFEEMFDEIVAVWRTGDSARLDALILPVMREHPEIHKKFLIDRNHAWMEELEKLLQREEDVFVVVGAAHLVGTESVIDLLNRRGHKVEQK